MDFVIKMLKSMMGLHVVNKDRARAIYTEKYFLNLVKSKKIGFY